MPSDVVISVNHVSKAYTIWKDPAARLKHPMLQLAGGMFPFLRKKIEHHLNSLCSEFYALKDVSFEVKKGEAVGIIGRNGSGKSTLLQIIAGTLQPSSGSVTVNGRVAALLELGSGFNPEFTGRENVFLNASILGLTRKETEERFGKIEAFADIGEFINQPVKTYSSGMVVRLAFAVMAHVDADILIIDEALAVGDAIFVQKCMRFIREFQQKGILLFVSHDQGSIQNLCKTAIWLDHGLTRMIGSSKEIAEKYLQYTLQEIYGGDVKLHTTKDNTNKTSQDGIPPNDKNRAPFIDYEAKVTVKDNLDHAQGWQTGVAELLSIELRALDSTQEGVFIGGEKVQLVVKARAHQQLTHPIIGFTVRDRLGQELFGENTLPFTDSHQIVVEAGKEFLGEFVFQLPMLPNGQYALMASVANGTLYNHVQHHLLHDALILTVNSSKIRWGLVGISFDQVILKIAHE
jgi:lipopolysaccharide transport system ATP-binding protein